MGGSAASAATADEQLVSAVRAGSDGAFSRIYDRHAVELLSYCRHVLGSRGDAEDALQQAFLNAYRGLRQSRGPVAIRPWLFTIARNQCITMIRGWRERPSEDRTVSQTTPALPTTAEDREELRATLSDLARLPLEQRRALVLSGVQTRSGAEVAGLLDIEPDRVKALVFRARRSLSQSRESRETSCVEIRGQLASLSGGSLRRTVLREHLLACAGCREYRQRMRARAVASSGLARR